MSGSFSTSIGIVRAFRDLGISLRFLSRGAIKLLMLADMTFLLLAKAPYGPATIALPQSAALKKNSFHYRAVLLAAVFKTDELVGLATIFVRFTHGG